MSRLIRIYIVCKKNDLVCIAERVKRKEYTFKDIDIYSNDPGPEFFVKVCLNLKIIIIIFPSFSILWIQRIVYNECARASNIYPIRRIIRRNQA